ncbi:CACTA en-spm transposon protein [Cucumis melo var. makuwa]|uniref:CACTA en-spm transposon protein n=1 Tax=Cucumis melo var. makuwa TaxID=1194695 RepID=A0A5A7V694_CUCMM|nr:CACTA en-spm transposon protein [Cucumis melo var. makuwa]TYK09380.1 CACTA en-spm transposon protein [Cucumis melo var. makuwa]
MLSTFKEFRGDCHRHFKKYSDLEEARANPPYILVGRMEDWYYLCDHYMSRAFQKQPYNHAAGGSHFYNDSMSSLSKESQLTLDGSQPLSENEISKTVLGRRLGYSKGFGWGPKPKSCKMTSATNASTLFLQSTIEL